MISASRRHGCCCRSFRCQIGAGKEAPGDVAAEVLTITSENQLASGQRFLFPLSGREKGKGGKKLGEREKGKGGKKLGDF